MDLSDSNVFCDYSQRILVSILNLVSILPPSACSPHTPPTPLPQPLPG